MFRKLQETLSPPRKKARATSPIKLSPGVGSHRQAPPAKGTEVTQTAAAGIWNFNVFNNLLATQKEAEKDAKRRVSPVAEQKPYTLMPGGHRETITLAHYPDKADTLESLLLARDHIAWKKTHRGMRHFSMLHRPWYKPPEPSSEEAAPSEEQDPEGPPQLPEFRTTEGLFIDEAMGSETGDGEAGENELRETADTADQVELVNGNVEYDIVDDHFSDYSDSSSDRSFKRWVSGEGEDDDELDFADDGVVLGLGTDGHVRHFVPIPDPPRPQIRPAGKYHFSTTGALRRFEYMVSHLDLIDWDGRPVSILLHLIQYSPYTAYKAARRNPAFLRAALEIDWTDIKLAITESDPENARKVIGEWIVKKQGRLFANDIDADGFSASWLQEHRRYRKWRWPELVAAENFYRKAKGKNGLRDERVYSRVVEEREHNPRRRGKSAWKPPGKSRLGQIVRGPENFESEEADEAVEPVSDDSDSDSDLEGMFEESDLEIGDLEDSF